MVAASACCSVLLATSLQNKTSFPGSQAYNVSLASYYSAQEEQIHPSCIVSPSTTEDVSVAVSTLANHSCQFAIRSGGHAQGTGTANIAGGVTLDLSGVDAIALSNDRSTISVGPGARWISLYSILEPLNLMVLGGRVSSVGVGGLLLGGGISFFSPRYGFAFDSVTNLEVVLANGSVVEANSHQNPELLRALRGGSNNFGVVTRFDLKTFEQGPFWGGNVFYSIDTVPQQLSAISELSQGSPYDEYASLIAGFFRSSSGASVIHTIQYTKDEENPAVFKPFTDIASLDNTLRTANVSSFAIEGDVAAPPGARTIIFTLTHGSSLEMLNATYNAWNDSFAALEDIPGIQWSLLMDPFPPAIYSRAAPGSNVLGLSGQQENLVVLLVSAGWTYESDDARVMQILQETVATMKSQSQQLGEDNDFLYLNYAGVWQDPIAGYGAENVAELRKVSAAYDPSGVFQKDVPGGFKLF